ncbi:hypothetical protein HI914_04526 [Erysiphe necator]|nr:hypothetical protein HI914_04526 [Erysiphe necator]
MSRNLSSEIGSQPFSDSGSEYNINDFIGVHFNFLEIIRGVRERGLHPCDFEGPLARVVRKLLDEDYDIWGFIVIKTWRTSTEVWELFWGHFMQYLAEVLKERGIMVDFSLGLGSKLSWVLVDEEYLYDATPAQVRTEFQSLIEDENSCPVGVDVNIALMFDENSASSLINLSPDTPPFVIAVTRSVDDEDACDDSETSFSGVFKIAMDALITDIWYLLACGTSPRRLDPGSEGIYTANGYRNEHQIVFRNRELLSVFVRSTESPQFNYHHAYQHGYQQGYHDGQYEGYRRGYAYGNLIENQNRSQDGSEILSQDSNQNETIHEAQNENRNGTVNENRNGTVNENRNGTVNENRNGTVNGNQNGAQNGNLNGN